MEDASHGTEHACDEIRSHARDLLRRFAGGSVSDSSQPVASEEESGNIELRLGLSLGGSFGVDPKDKGLVRSSSVASFSFSGEREPVVASAAQGLARTFSLPVVTEEEHRKRREIRRIQAKRKRSEKKGSAQRSMPKAVEIPAKVVDRGCGATVLPPSGKEGVIVAEVEVRGSKRLPDVVRFEEQKGYTFPSTHRANNLHRQPERASTQSVDESSLPMSEERAAAVESMSPGVTSVDFQQIQGLRISASGVDEDHTSFAYQVPSSASTTVTACDEFSNDAHIRTVVEGKRLSEASSSVMKRMPCVSTKGVGPSGQKIDGFLYKYGKGEEVRIVCVCHGNFLTPAEFVKHAGGDDVSHPLRHIVVNPLGFLSK